jgi:NO-binding membrane sensor protein with MHYT domain
MGTGIWAMHFIGMLAYYLPVSIAYNLPIVIVSWLAAVIASGIAFYSLHRGFAHRFSLLIPGILMGSGMEVCIILAWLRCEYLPKCTIITGLWHCLS